MLEKWYVNPTRYLPADECASAQAFPISRLHALFTLALACSKLLDALRPCCAPCSGSGRCARRGGAGGAPVSTGAGLYQCWPPAGRSTGSVSSSGDHGAHRCRDAQDPEECGHGGAQPCKLCLWFSLVLCLIPCHSGGYTAWLLQATTERMIRKQLESSLGAKVDDHKDFIRSQARPFLGPACS